MVPKLDAGLLNVDSGAVAPDPGPPMPAPPPGAPAPDNDWVAAACRAASVADAIALAGLAADRAEPDNSGPSNPNPICGNCPNVCGSEPNICGSPPAIDIGVEASDIIDPRLSMPIPPGVPAVLVSASSTPAKLRRIAAVAGRSPADSATCPASAAIPAGLAITGANGAGTPNGAAAPKTAVSQPDPADALVAHWSPYSSYSDVTIGVKNPCQFAAAHASADSRVPNAPGAGIIEFFAGV